MSCRCEVMVVKKTLRCGQFDKRDLWFRIS